MKNNDFLNNSFQPQKKSTDLIKSPNELELTPSWYQVLNDYNLHQLIGKGSFGQVVKASCKISNQIVAIKNINNIFLSFYNSIKIIREIKIMRELTGMVSNNFTVKLLDIIYPQQPEFQDEIFLIMEYVDFDIRDLLSNNFILNEQKIETIIYNSLCALNYLSSANIVHRDIKPENILVDQYCNVKICDFGLSRTLPQSCFGKGSGSTKRIRDSIMKLKQDETIDEKTIKQSISLKLQIRREERKIKNICLSNHVATRWYRAPELILIEKQYDYASDMWSFGCIIYELYQKLQCSENQKDFQVLFKGDSCFPMSPKFTTNQNGFQKIQQNDVKKDQLQQIIQKLGFQTSDDLSFLTDDIAIEYASQLNSQTNNKICFKNVFPDRNPQMMELLNSILEFNPFFRPSALETIMNPVFDKIRDQNNQIQSTHKIVLQIDMNGSYDYQANTDFHFDKTQFKKAIEEEVFYIKSERKKILKTFMPLRSE